MENSAEPRNFKKELSDEPMTLKTPIATPKKRGSAKKVGEPGEDGTPAKKQRKQAVGIPDNYEDLAAEDKIMLKMKEDGKNWKEINETWFTITGQKHTNLATRYARVKATISHVSDADLPTLESAMKRVELRLEEEKKALEKRHWAMLIEEMASDGANTYDAPTLKKAWRRIQNESV